MNGHGADFEMLSQLIERYFTQDRINAVEGVAPDRRKLPALLVSHQPGLIVFGLVSSGARVLHGDVTAFRRVEYVFPPFGDASATADLFANIEAVFEALIEDWKTRCVPALNAAGARARQRNN